MLKNIICLFLLLAFCIDFYCAEQPTPQLKQYIKECVECSDWNEEDPKMEGRIFKYEFSGKYNIIYANKKIFSYYAEERFYEGGAHGRNKVTVGSLWRVSGNKITLKDIAPTDKLKKRLLDLIIVGTAEKFQCSIKDLPKKLLKMPFLIDNFYFDDKGINFVYNEYDIASKGVGTIKILVPYSKYPIKIQ